MTDIKKGDRAKVTIEGEVVFTGVRSIEVRTDSGGVVEAYTPQSPLSDKVTVEKIEPPVEVFKPGDLLRSRESGAFWYLAPNGYVRMVSSGFSNATTFNPYEDSRFTSEEYERVSLDSLA